MTLTIPSDLGLLRLARAFIEGTCRKRGLDDTTTHGIVLAVNEGLSNAIRHAHRDRPESQVRLECCFVPGAIEVRLTDEGDPFDLTAVPQLDPAELRLGGRGVFIMRALMDELSCERCGAGGNALRMVKRLPRSESTTKE